MKKNISIKIKEQDLTYKTIKIQNCCNHNKKAKQCKTKKRTFKLPRRFSRKKCLTQKIRGFSMKSSCTPYLNCKR